MTSIRISGSDEVIEVIERGPQSPNLPGYDPVTQTLTANVLVRSGKLETLLALADASDGEIAVASDADVIVKYRGNPPVPTTLGASYVIGRILFSTNLAAETTIPSGVLTPINLSAQEDRLSLFDDILQTFTWPTMVPNEQVWAKFSGSFAGGNGLGTSIKLAIEYELAPGFWWGLTTDVITMPISSQQVSFNLNIPRSSTYAVFNCRLTVEQDSGVDVSNYRLNGILEFGI